MSKRSGASCREHAENALKSQTRDFKRLGILGEWDDPYLTMSNHYEAETARMFARFVERGYVYKGARPVYWCIKDQTALAEAEVEYHKHQPIGLREVSAAQRSGADRSGARGTTSVRADLDHHAMDAAGEPRHRGPS